MRAQIAFPALAVITVITTAPVVARANSNDFRLNARSGGDGVLFTTQDGRYLPLDERWRAFATELGYVLAPRLASPTETLGHAGFHVGVMWSGTSISSDEPYWRVTEAGQTGAPSSMLHTLQLDVRKGLPFSFELGVNVMWLLESQLFAPGLEVRWGLQEGYDYIPDLSVRGSVNHMVGNRDMQLTTAGFDIGLSKGFGLLGMVHVTPYVSWGFLFVAASSRVIDPTPTVEVDNGAGFEADLANNFVYSEIKPDLNHKLTIGLRTIYYVLNVSVQGELQMLTDDGFVGPVKTISTKLGLDF
ncbi:hypothetical protein L6R52_30920 [Myxococcota bacterium]|nr:hypothetical protein [Myxococcota bacterium]